MVSITATTFSDLVNAASLAAAAAEKIIDQAIDLLNLYGDYEETINNMSGSEGSKTLTVEGYERGAILSIARVIYKSFYKDEGASVGVGGINLSSSDMMMNPDVQRMIKLMSKLLAKRRRGLEMDVDIG